MPAFDRLVLRPDLTPPQDQWDRLVPVAKLGKVWGVHGDLTVRLYNADSDLAWAADVLLMRGDGFPLIAVEIERWQTKGAHVLLRPVGIDSPQVARALTNLEILLFLVMMFVCGSMYGFVETFLFVFLKEDLHAPM